MSGIFNEYDPKVDELRRLCIKATEAQWIAGRDLGGIGLSTIDFAATPLSAALPVEQTSCWKSLPEEKAWSSPAGRPPFG
jgi:hypothetical protein